MKKSRGQRQQRGVIGLFAMLVLLLAVVFTALAIDASRLWMIKRQLQSVADITAIEAAKGMGCDSAIDAVIARAETAAAANGYDADVNAGGNSVMLGKIVDQAGVRVFQPNAAPEAVRVVLTKMTPASLVAGGIFSDPVLLQAQATSLSNSPIASFSAGTTTLNLDTRESALLNQLFSGMLGGQVDLDAVAYQGLANADIRLADILTTQTQVSTVDQLLNLQLPTRELLSLIAGGVMQSQNTSENALAGLKQLVAASQRNTGLALSDVLIVNSLNPVDLSQASLNLLSLVTSVITFSNGQTGIDLPLAVNIPGITNIGSTVKVIQAPKIAIGPPAGVGGIACTSARTAQIEINVDARVNVPLLASLDMRLSAEVAPGRVDLIDIRYQGTSTAVDFEQYPGVVGVRLTNSTGSGPAVLSSLLNAPLAKLSLNLPSTLATPKDSVIEVGNPIAGQLPRSVSTSTQLSSTFANMLGNEQSISVEVLGINLPIINQVVKGVAQPILVQAGAALIDPLMKIFGIRVGVIDVKLDDVRMGNPRPLVI